MKPRKLASFLPYLLSMCLVIVVAAASPAPPVQGGGIFLTKSQSKSDSSTDTLYAVPSNGAGVYRINMTIRVTSQDTYTVDTVLARNYKAGVMCTNGNKTYTVYTDTLQAKDTVNIQKGTVAVCYASASAALRATLAKTGAVGNPTFAITYDVEKLR